MKNRLPTTLITVFILFLIQSVWAQIKEPQKIARESEIDVKTYTGIISEQYANGSPSLWKTLVNGKTEGLWLEWYNNGPLRYRAYWKNSLGHGKWEYFYPNGQLRSESFFIDDIAQGMLKSYHENGQLNMDVVFQNGKKDGVEFIYDENGILLSRKRYENGVQRIDEPIIFEKGNISSENSNEWGISFMPDGNTAYFTRRDVNTGKKRIYETTKTENRWSTPKIASFSVDEDEGAFVTKDGNKLFFASYKPLPDGTTIDEMDMNIWYLDRIGDKWSAPKPLSQTVNKSMKKDNVWPANYEAGPMTDADGNLYYWTKGAESKGTNLFYAPLLKNGSYGKPQDLLPPSSKSYFDTGPKLSPDGNILFFGSDNRNDGYGGSDIYYSVKSGNSWSTPKNLGPVVNSYKSDSPSSFSPDGKYFYFTSNRGDVKDAYGESIYNLYYIETEYLMIEK